jgi:hypothetical protein
VAKTAYPALITDGVLTLMMENYFGHQWFIFLVLQPMKLNLIQHMNQDVFPVRVDDENGEIFIGFDHISKSAFLNLDDDL